MSLIEGSDLRPGGDDFKEQEHDRAEDFKGISSVRECEADLSGFGAVMVQSVQNNTASSSVGIMLFRTLLFNSDGVITVDSKVIN